MTDHRRDLDPQLRDLLDSSFGDGPPPPAPADRLAPGRRALRRRRLASGAVSVTAVAGLVLGAGLLTGGDGARAVDPLPVATGTGTPDATPTPDGPTYDGAYQSELCLTFDEGVEPSEQDLNDLDLEYDPGTGTLEPACDLGGAPVGDPLLTLECLSLLGERAGVQPDEEVPVRYDRDAGFAHLAGDTPAEYDPRCRIADDVAVEPTPEGSR